MHIRTPESIIDCPDYTVWVALVGGKEGLTEIKWDCDHMLQVAIGDVE